jgi:Zn-dependent protease
MTNMTRDRIVVYGLLAAAVVLALTRHVVSSRTVLLIAVVVPSIILHEVSHGVAALAFGDDTAKRAGRLTLNPIPHIDPFGTILLPALLALSSLGVFGYAKPVPIDPSRMRNPRNDAVWVSLAGPATNIVLALLAALWLRAVHPFALATDFGPWRVRIPVAFGIVNVVLAVFNLLPIPPLDGSSVITRFLPEAWHDGWATLQKYGMVVLIVIVLLRPQALSRVFNPALNLWVRVISR